MDTLVTNIYEVVKDYRAGSSFQMTTAHILNWAAQFETDAEFMLQELNHIIKKTYLSKSEAQKHLLHQVNRLIQGYNYQSIVAFLSDTLFLEMQKDAKSQKAILDLLDEVLQREYGQSYKTYLGYPKKNFIYWDDVLATGGTIGAHLIQWLNEKHDHSEENFKKIVNNQYRLSVQLFCVHTWGSRFNDSVFKNYLAAQLTIGFNGIARF